MSYSYDLVLLWVFVLSGDCIVVGIHTVVSIPARTPQLRFPRLLDAQERERQKSEKTDGQTLSSDPICLPQQCPQ
jgi:hypothetical protein